MKLTIDQKLSQIYLILLALNEEDISRKGAYESIEKIVNS